MKNGLEGDFRHIFAVEVRSTLGSTCPALFGNSIGLTVVKTPQRSRIPGKSIRRLETHFFSRPLGHDEHILYQKRCNSC